MIKFFRRIRQSLISEGKVRKPASPAGRYFLYAIGEITLVMIGILLALQVNNLNESRKVRIKENSYLHSLKDQFTQNLQELEITDSLVSNQLSAGRELLTFCGPTTAGSVDSIFVNLYHRSFKDFNQFIPSSGVFKAIENSGHLSFFSNATLREKLASWDSKIQLLKEQESEARNVINQMQEFVIQNGNFRTQIHRSNLMANFGETQFDPSNADLLRNERFESILAVYLGVTQSLLSNYYSMIRNEINSILNIIESEIND